MRRKEYSSEQVANLFRLLGVNIEARLQPCKNHQERLAAIEQAKRDAKENYRRLAFEHHPDRGGDEETFKELNAVWTVVEHLNLSPPQPKPQHIPAGFGVVTIVINTGTSATVNVTGTTATGGFGW